MAIKETGTGRYLSVASFRGLSTDDKPLNVDNGAEFLEMDTGDIYYFNQDALVWVKGGSVFPRPTDDQVEAAVSDWLDAHPEATTTVEDGAVTQVKLSDTYLGVDNDGLFFVYVEE